VANRVAPVDRILRGRRWLLLLLAALIASRLCHVGILWTEEDLPLAAALQVLKGSVLYRDVWFDKPPLTALVYVLWGAQTGWILRLVGAFYVWVACVMLYRFGASLWGEREGRAAAVLCAFFLAFWIPSAVIPLAADLLMLVPHVAAVYLASRGRPLAGGAAAGVAFLFNSKAVFVLAACGLWNWRAVPKLVLGFLVPNVLAFGALASAGALGAWHEQVWELGKLYASHTFLDEPLQTGAARTLNWMGFHAAAILAALWFWRRERGNLRWIMAAWVGLSLAAVAAGWRFFPRYYVQLLPPVMLAAARGFTLLEGRWRLAVAALLLVPLVRFGPRYALLAADLATGREHTWSDIAMNQDSQRATRIVSAAAKPGDTLFVWGYRPDIFAYTRLKAGTRFLECQPMTGVFADRHLFQAEPLAPELTLRNRTELARSRPTFVVDGLSLYNRRLAISQYPELREWFAHYVEIGRTPSTVVYRRHAAASSPDSLPR